MAANASKVHYGIQDLVIYFRDTAKDADGTPAYEKGISVPGTVHMNATVQSSDSNFAADNNPNYFNMHIDKGDEYEWETANIPNAVKARMFGWALDAQGNIVRTTDGVRESFGASFRVEGDADKRYKVLYNCKAKPGNQNNETKSDNVDVQAETATITASEISIKSGDVTHRVVDYTVDEANGGTAYETIAGGTIALPVYKATATASTGA